MTRCISNASLTTKFLVTLTLIAAFALPFGCGGGGGGGSETPTPPTVTGTTPLDNSPQVHPNSDVVITFSTAMDTTTVQAAIDFSPATTITYSPADWNPGMTVLTITPDNGLLEDTLYTVTVGTGAQDADATALESAYSFDFTTGSETPTPPTVTGTTPLDNSSQVHPGTDVIITFSTAMDILTVQAATNFSPATSLSFGWNPGMTVLTITPDSSLDEATSYTVTVGTGAQDSEGAALESVFSFDFTTGDVPYVADSSPSPAATNVSPDEWVGFQFSEPMSTASVEANLNVVPSATYSTRWEEGNSVFILDFSPALAASTSYTVTIGAASTDLEGTAMGTAEVLSFTTENRPFITMTSPANGDTTVSTSSDFVITFSDAMDSTAQQAVTVPGYVGVVNSSMDSSTVIRLAFSPALADTTIYTVQVTAEAENSNGTHLDGSYEFVFSTGGPLTGQIVSGQVTESSVAVSGAVVKLLTSNSEVGNWQYDFAKIAVTDGSGNYSMSLVQDGTYWPAAVEDTNGDGQTHLQFGDAFGIADTITVDISDLPNTDISIHDPEAISGSILYNGAYASSITGAADNMNLYAFIGTDVLTGAIYLSNDIESGTTPDAVNQYNNSDDWAYWLNPYLDPAISVSGGAQTGLTQNFNTWIPDGDYQIMAMVNGGNGIDAAGFSQSQASISGSGDDATGVNITLYDLISIGGRTEVIDSLESESAPYGSAQVSLLNWPLYSVVTDGYWNTQFPTGGYYYNDTPAGLPIAVHADPDPADAASFAAFNTQYLVFSTSDDGEEMDVIIIGKELMDGFAAQAGTTIQPGKATILAFVTASQGSSRQTVAGASVSLSTGNPAYYADSSLNLGYPYTQYMGEDGSPSVMFFNVDPAGAGVSDGVATMTVTHPDTTNFSFDTVYLPVRADEVTFAEAESDTGYDQAPGYVIYGNVRNVQAETGASGASVIFHEAAGAVLGTTTTDSAGDFAFFGIPYSTRGYVSASDSGFVTINSEVGTITDNVELFLPFVPEAMAASVASLLSEFNESSWNSTLQSYTWYLADVTDPVENAVSGVQLTMSATGADTAYYNSATGDYDATSTTSQGTNGPMIIGYAPNSSAGLYSIDASGGVDPATKEIRLLPGEFTYIEWVDYSGT